MNDHSKRFRIRPGFIAVCVGVLLAGSVWLGPFHYSSVCQKCGAIRDATDWQIPLTSITLFETSSVRPTPVSEALARQGLVAKHDHDWAFIQGGGNGIRCAIGKGGDIWQSAESDDVAKLLDDCQRFGDMALRNRLVRLMFDTQTSRAVLMRGSSRPAAGFANADDFHAWFDEEKDSFETIIGWNDGK